jgi:hypothetical protein
MLLCYLHALDDLNEVRWRVRERDRIVFAIASNIFDGRGLISG